MFHPIGYYNTRMRVDMGGWCFKVFHPMFSRRFLAFSGVSSRVARVFQGVSPCCAAHPDTLIKAGWMAINSVLGVAKCGYCCTQVAAETSLILGVVSAFAFAPFQVAGVQVAAGDIARRAENAALADKLGCWAGDVVQLTPGDPQHSQAVRIGRDHEA